MTHFPKSIKIGFTNRKAVSLSGLVPIVYAIRNSNFFKSLTNLFFHKKQRRRGYEIGDKILALYQVLLSGGKHICDVNRLQCERGYLDATGVESLPSANTLSEFLSDMDDGDAKSFAILNLEMVSQYYRENKINSITLDIDSSLVKCWKDNAEYTYEMFKGFNPMFILDEKNGLVLGAMFRNGNAAPQSDILKILKEILEKLDDGIVDAVRIDSAGYQKEIIDFLNERRIGYAIAGRCNASKTAFFRSIPDELWNKRNDEYEITQTEDFISTGNQITPIRIIVKRKLKNDPDLLEGIYTHYYLVTNLTLMQPDEIYDFYDRRGNAENIFKELKMDFCLESFPSNSLATNSFFLQVLVSAYNIFQILKTRMFEKGWRNYTARTIRHRVICVAGFVSMSGRQRILKIPKEYIYADVLVKAMYMSAYALL